MFSFEKQKFGAKFVSISNNWRDEVSSFSFPGGIWQIEWLKACQWLSSKQWHVNGKNCGQWISAPMCKVITSILTVRKSWTKGNHDLPWAYERAEAAGQTATMKSGETVLPRRTQLDPLQIRILWWQCWELLEAEHELTWEWKMPGEISHSGLYTIMGFTFRNPTDSHFEELGRPLCLW